MSEFVTKLVLIDSADDRNWVLDEDFVYISDIAQMTITVPKGFETDLASCRVGPLQLDAGRKGAVIHDYIYRTKGIAKKAVADKVFLEAMKLEGVPLFRRQYMYWAVRLFGGKSYKGGL